MTRFVRPHASIVLLAIASACNSGSPTAADPAKAYSDGFQVVVLDLDPAGSIAAARSLPLKEAEHAIVSGATALLPADTEPVARLLSAGKAADFRVTLSATEIDARRQRVHVSFQEPKRTYDYEYEVDGTTLMPLSSSYRDLAKSSSVKYAPAR
jgi:hypothetical protein